MTHSRLSSKGNPHAWTYEILLLWIGRNGAYALVSKMEHVPSYGYATKYASVCSERTIASKCQFS